MPRFDIILTTFNRLAYTQRTVASLIGSGALEACERLIVVDNHSIEDGMEGFLNDLAHYQKVFVLRRPRNDGWGMAVNDALGVSRAPYLFIINNDVEFQPSFYEAMLRTIMTTRQDIPGVGSRGIGLLAGWKHTAHGFGGFETEDFREMDNVPAVAWLMTKGAMAAVGMMKENGPCATKGGNGEDTDYVLRMKEQGFLVGAMREDVANHIDGY